MLTERLDRQLRKAQTQEDPVAIRNLAARLRDARQAARDVEPPRGVAERDCPAWPEPSGADRYPLRADAAAGEPARTVATMPA